MIELPPDEPAPEKPAARPAGPATQWKKSATPPQSRGGLLTLATLLFCAVAGVTVGVVLLLGAAKKPYLITLPIETYGRDYPAATAAQADAEWLLKVFDADRRENATNLVTEVGAFRKKLGVLGRGGLLPDVVGATERVLEADRPLVIHVACHAAARDGRVYLLPVDATADSAGWVPLDQLLDALGGCPARDKCLLLDVGRPRTRTFVGPYSDDTSAPLHAHLKSLQGADKLPCPVLVSCGEREFSHVMAATGVSAFAYYAAEGLRGGADGATPGSARDGNVTVRELHAFLKLRVGRWAKRNRDAAQSPVLYADGRDFKLTYGVHGNPPATTEEADDKPRDVADPYRAAADKWVPAAAPPATGDDGPGRSILAVPLPATPAPVPGAPPAADPCAAVAAAFEAFWKAKGAAKPDAARVEEAKGKYDAAAAALPPQVVGRTLWAWLLDKHPAPRTGLLLLLQETLAPLKPAGFRELATLDFVLRADNDIANSTAQGEELAGRLFGVEKEFAGLLRLGEPSSGWVRPQAVALLARQRAIEKRLAAGRAVTPGELEALRAAAADAAESLRAAQEARAALDFAVNRLTGTAHAVAEFGRPAEKPWNACLEAAVALANQIDREPAADGTPGDWRRLTAELRDAVKPLVTHYESIAVKALLDAAPKAGPAELRVLEATRAAPFLSPKDRDALALAVDEVVKRLHATTRREFDLPENASGVMPAPERPPDPPGHDAPRVRLAVSRGLHALAGLGPVEPASVAAAWGKGHATLAAELLKKGDGPRLDRLATVVPFTLDGDREPLAGVSEARAARQQRERAAYRAWRATCTR